MQGPLKARGVNRKFDKGDEERFIREFMKDYDATRAAMRAGLCDTPYSAMLVGERMACRGRVAAEIERRKEILNRQYLGDAEAIMRELRKIAYSNIADYHDLSGPIPTPDFTHTNAAQYAAISELTIETFTDGKGEDMRFGRRVKVKLYDKPAALVTIGKQLGMFHTKPESEEQTAIRVTGGLPETEPC